MRTLKGIKVLLLASLCLCAGCGKEDGDAAPVPAGQETGDTSRPGENNTEEIGNTKNINTEKDKNSTAESRNPANDEPDANQNGAGEPGNADYDEDQNSRTESEIPDNVGSDKDQNSTGESDNLYVRLKKRQHIAFQRRKRSDVDARCRHQGSRLPFLHLGRIKSEVSRRKRYLQFSRIF